MTEFTPRELAIFTVSFLLFLSILAPLVFWWKRRREARERFLFFYKGKKPMKRRRQSTLHPTSDFPRGEKEGRLGFAQKPLGGVPTMAEGPFDDLMGWPIDGSEEGSTFAEKSLAEGADADDDKPWRD